MPETLAQKVRAKFPGAYDDISDGELEQRVKAKYPGVYDDIPTTPAQPVQGLLSKVGEVAGDVAIGAAKGLGNTVFGLGKVVRDYTPIGRISDAILPGAFDQRPPEIVPTNTAQKVGYTGEQIGEFFIPTGAAGKLGKAAEVGKSIGLTMAQGGSPTEAGVSGALTAVLPGGGVAKKAAGALQEGAEKGVAQALGATTNAAKAEASRLAPEMLKRGVRGSRGAMLAKAEQAVATTGPKLAAAVKDAASQGATVSTDVVRGTLQLAADDFLTKSPEGAAMIVPGAERIVGRLKALDRFLEKMGPDLPVDKATAIKQAWDGIVAKSGLYGAKASASATDAADAWVYREAASTFRRLLNENPSIGALNKEYSFWAGLKDVLSATELRTQAQSGGLLAGIGTATGAASGFASGDSLEGSIGKAIAGGVMFRKATQLMQSPWFRTTVSSRLKAGLADALASGRADQIERAAERILAAAPAQAQ